MITNWDVPFLIESPYLASPFGGNLALNTHLGNDWIFILMHEGCSADRPLRVTSDAIPQGDGEILHRRFTHGYTVTLQISCWTGRDLVSATPACDTVLQQMIDVLMGHFNAMLNAADARLLWTPVGMAQRMFTNLRWLSFPTVRIEEGTTIVTVSFDTEFPYEISSLQTTPAFGTPFTNNGNADFYPVLHVVGPSSAFLVTNGSAGIVYDASRPGAVALGGGDYAEIDCFRNTIVLNGNVYDLDAGVDPTLSTFFTLPPGANTVTVSGATGYTLMNDAWA